MTAGTKTKGSLYGATITGVEAAGDGSRYRITAVEETALGRKRYADPLTNPGAVSRFFDADLHLSETMDLIRNGNGVVICINLPDGTQVYGR